MLLTKEVEVSVGARNLAYYKEKGYDIPMCYSEKSCKFVVDFSKKITVKIEDLPPSSHIKIQYKCDNCGEVFTTEYATWNQSKYKDLGDLCKKCAVKIKLPQVMLDRYGFANSANVPSIQDKKKQTNLERYGNEWAIASEEVKDKIALTWLSNYQVNNPMKNDEVKQKAINTNKIRYGGNSPMCDITVKEKSVATCIERYGVSNPYQSKEIQKKARETLYKNNTTPTSKAEKDICNILKEIYGEENCYPSFPEGNLSLDCFVKVGREKIDVEYDGYYWHKNRERIDAARNSVLIKQGYRILRIKGNNKDTMPTKAQIQEAIQYLIKENHRLIFIDMNI